MTARIIVTKPFEQTSVAHDVPAGGLLSDALIALSPSRWNGSTFELYEGAIGPAGVLPQQDATKITLRDGDVIQVVVLPAEPISASLILAAGVTATSAAGIAITIAVYVAVMAVTMAISFLATMLLSPGKQANKALAPEDQPSALNSLSPPRNAYRLGSRIPEIYGTVRFWPDLIFNATVRWNPVAWDADAGSWSENPRATSEQQVQAVYCLGRGHYQLADLQFGDSPIANANGSMQVFPPGVMLPASVTATYAVANLSRQELGGPGSVNMWSSWYEIPADEIDRFDVQVSFPNGLIRAYSGKKVPPGYVETQVADIRIQAERLDPLGNVVEAWERARPVGSKTRNELRITFVETVTPGRWRVRVAEVNPQPPFPNGNIETVIKKTALEGIIGHRSLTDAERTYAHETVLVVTANNIGGPALQNMESFNLLATRVLPTQDLPGQMTEWRADGRWITAAIHTLTDPWVCNYPMDEVDWPSLHAVQASLDAYAAPFGESGFHAALDRQMSADEQLMLIARKARAQVFPSGGKITFARDERRSGVSALFNRRNRLLGRSDIGMGLQFAGRDDPDGVVVSWIDADNGYRQDTYTFPTDITPAAPLNIDLIGAVHKWEVCRRARFEMAQIQYRRRSMPLRVTEEGQLLLPYDRVSVVMPWDEGTSDGEVLEIDGLALRLSRVVPEGLTSEARIRLRAPDGRQTALVEVAADPGRGPDWVVLSSPPAFSILAPTDDTQLGTLYSLSRTDADETATHWLMTGAEIDDQGVAITLMEDADEVFQLSDDVFDPCSEDGPPPPECIPISMPLNIPDPIILWPSGLDGGQGFWVNSSYPLYVSELAERPPVNRTITITNPTPGQMRFALVQPVDGPNSNSTTGLYLDRTGIGPLITTTHTQLSWQGRAFLEIPPGSPPFTIWSSFALQQTDPNAPFGNYLSAGGGGGPEVFPQWLDANGLTVIWQFDGTTLSIYSPWDPGNPSFVNEYWIGGSGLPFTPGVPLYYSPAIEWEAGAALPTVAPIVMVIEDFRIYATCAE